jgi:hypothetical protein
MDITLPTTGIGSTDKHADLLCSSYRRWVGQELIPDKSSRLTLKEQLFHADVGILSHGTEMDPVLNYGNKAALALWEMDWVAFTSTPSRYTAEPMERSQRERFFEVVASQGYVDNYTGIRISSTGRRFYILQAVVWNLIDSLGHYQGQAAAFTQYRYI